MVVNLTKMKLYYYPYYYPYYHLYYLQCNFKIAQC